MATYTKAGKSRLGASGYVHRQGTRTKVGAGVIRPVGLSALAVPPRWAGRAGMPQLVSEIDWLGNTTAPYYDQVAQEEGASAYWRMTDAAILHDSVGTNDGTVVGTPSRIAGAPLYDPDSALRFNGSSQYAWVPTASALLQPSYTLMGWVRFPSLPSALKVIVSKAMYRLHIDSTNKLVFGVTKDDNGVLTDTNLQSPAALVANTWYHVAAIYDSAADLMLLYVNGHLVASVAQSVGTEAHTSDLTFAGVGYATAPTFHAYAQSGTAFGVTASSLVLNMPTYTAGDLLLAHIYDQTTSASLTAPAGWQLLVSSGPDGQNTRSRWYWKVAVTGEPATYTWTAGAAGAYVGAISSWSGVATANPFALPPHSYIGGGFSPTTRQHMVESYNARAIAFASAFFVTAGDSVSSWSSGTERYDIAGIGGSIFGMAIADQVPTFDTVLEVTANTTGNGNPHCGLIVLAGTGVGSYTQCDLDEWAYFGRALSASEVALKYEARASGLGAWQQLVDSVDGTPEVRSVIFSYGRQYELGRMEGVSGQMQLKNRRRAYDPTNTSSPYYPHVRPNRRLRLRAYYQGVYYPLYQGFVERFPSSWDVPDYDEMDLTLADGMKTLNRAGVSGSLAAGLSGAQVATVLDRALHPRSARSLDSGKHAMAADTSDGTAAALGVLQDIGDSELGIIFVDHAQNGSPVVFQDRAHRWSDARALTPQVVFSDQPTGTQVPYIDLQPSDDDENMVNEWQVAAANGTQAIATDPRSRQQNGPATQQRSTRLDNPSDAAEQAAALLIETALPQVRFDTLVVRLGALSPAARWQSVFALRISDRVTVIKNPVASAGGPAIQRDCFIEGVAWEINPNYWQVSYQLSPVAPSGYEDAALALLPVSYWRFATTT